MHFLNSGINGLTIYAVYFALLRWSLILLIIYCWPSLVNTISKYATNPKACKSNWITERFRIGSWLVLFELLVCENIIEKLVHLFK